MPLALKIRDLYRSVSVELARRVNFRRIGGELGIGLPSNVEVAGITIPICGTGSVTFTRCGVAFRAEGGRGVGGRVRRGLLYSRLLTRGVKGRKGEGILGAVGLGRFIGSCDIVSLGSGAILAMMLATNDGGGVGPGLFISTLGLKSSISFYRVLGRGVVARSLGDFRWCFLGGGFCGRLGGTYF